MLNNSLVNPSNIAIIGASNNKDKPGARLLLNILEGGFKGDIFPVNPKEKQIQSLPCYSTVKMLPETELAILAIPAQLCVEAVKELASTKGTKAFIIISAGFSESNAQGQLLEEKLLAIAKEKDLCIIGPNCIGVLTTKYNAFFVSSLPKIEEQGVDFVSASGAFAVFVFETAALQGLKFGSVYSVGNSVVTGVEEVLKYWDENYVPGKSGRVKLVYVEQIKNPELFFKHTYNLRKKGCHILVIKPGDSEVGARAALSHTGALTGDKEAFDYLFQKAGAIRTYSREEMVYLASILSQKELKGKRLAIISHAGGPAVMLSDKLQQAGFEIPEIDPRDQLKLLEQLHPGSSALNPVDILATANRDQLNFSISYCAQLNYIDGIIIIYGRTGLEDLYKTFTLLGQTIQSISKPVYAVLPSVWSGRKEIDYFIGLENLVYPDEVVLANCLAKAFNKPLVFEPELYLPVNTIENSQIIVLSEEEVRKRLRACKIPYAKSQIAKTKQELNKLKDLHYPAVVKALGILHKTDQHGVVLNVQSKQELLRAYNKLTSIPGSSGVLIQQMLQGTELYLGGKMHKGIGWSVHAGLGGIFVEAWNDRISLLAPVSLMEAKHMLSGLRIQQIFEGYRNLPPVNCEAFARLLVSFSHIFQNYPDITEIDLNPLIAIGDKITAVDARIITEVPNT